MIYAISDTHGCYDKYKELLTTIHFSPEDTLYVLGDVIDRGADGFKLLLDMARRPNVVNILGNHEDMAMKALPGILHEMGLYQGKELTEADEKAKNHWFRNGGELSLADFLWLDNQQKRAAWDYMKAMPLYQEPDVAGRRFLLLHGGLGNFSPERPLTDYTPHDILWCRPEPDTVYFPDKYVVFGHTPVKHLNPFAPAKIFHGDHIIDIDCGCVSPGGRLGCLCLDTMEEVYV